MGNQYLSNMRLKETLFEDPKICGNAFSSYLHLGLIVGCVSTY